MESNVRRLKCPMCFFSTLVPRSLMCHYIRNHRFDPHFTVKCVVSGCTATFIKWCSFKKYIQRKHRNHYDNLLNNIPLQNEPDVFQMANVLQLNIGKCEFSFYLFISYNSFYCVCTNYDVLFSEIADDNGHNEMHTLNWDITKFLLFIRDNCKTSQIAIQNIASGLQHFVSQLSSTLLVRLILTVMFVYDTKVV